MVAWPRVITSHPIILQVVSLRPQNFYLLPTKSSSISLNKGPLHPPISLPHPLREHVLRLVKPTLRLPSLLSVFRPLYNAKRPAYNLYFQAYVKLDTLHFLSALRLKRLKVLLPLMQILSLCVGVLRSCLLPL